MRECCHVFDYQEKDLQAVGTPFSDESKLIHAHLSVATQEQADNASTAPPVSVRTEPSEWSDDNSWCDTWAELVVEDAGELAYLACNCVMKVLYLARFGRLDLLRAVGVQQLD